jgi:hypothetical protein
MRSDRPGACNARKAEQRGALVAIPGTSFSLTVNDWHSLASAGLTGTSQPAQSLEPLDSGIVTYQSSVAVASTQATVTFTVDRTEEEVLIGTPYGPHAITITGKWSRLYRQ